MDFPINVKNFIRKIKGRQQFMKTIEGTDLNIQDSIMLLIFICRSAYELTFQYCYPHNSIPKEGHPTCPYTARSQLYWDKKREKETPSIGIKLMLHH